MIILKSKYDRQPDRLTRNYINKKYYLCLLIRIFLRLVEITALKKQNRTI